MTEQVRHQYRISLAGKASRAAPDPDFLLRHPNRDDRDALAELMLDAYRGTIDYEGEGIDEARVEVDDYLANEPMLSSSWVVEDEQTMLSAILVSPGKDVRVVGYVMTRASAKGLGLAGRLLERSLEELRDLGWAAVDAFITSGNTPSERLFARAGAALVE